MGVPNLELVALLSVNGCNEAITAVQAGRVVTLSRRPLIDAMLHARKLVMPLKAATA